MPVLLLSCCCSLLPASPMRRTGQLPVCSNARGSRGHWSSSPSPRASASSTTMNAPARLSRCVHVQGAEHSDRSGGRRHRRGGRDHPGTAPVTRSRTGTATRQRRAHSGSAASGATRGWPDELARRPICATSAEAHYGQLHEPVNVTEFWLDGSLRVSAEQQVGLLRGWSRAACRTGRTATTPSGPSCASTARRLIACMPRPVGRLATIWHRLVHRLC